MGNTKSSSSPNGVLRQRNGKGKPTLALMGASRKVYIKKVHIMMLRYAMAKVADDYGMVQREGFDEALERANLKSFEIFDLLFTVWDNAESRRVSYREFCMGISPLACPLDDINGVLEFALRVTEKPNREHIEWKEVYELLTGINSTASYFGDPKLLPDEIDEIVDTVFVDKEQISQKECVQKLSINPYVRRFASGKARSKVTFRDVLETKYIFDKEKLVTEYIVDCIDELALAPRLIDDSPHESSPRDKYSIPTDNNAKDELLLMEARYSLAPKKLFESPFADNDYENSISEIDENSGIAGNSKAPPPLDPPAVKKFGRQRSSDDFTNSTFPRMTGYSPSIPKKSRDP